jgi:signal recognition particle receptor subunit beta
MRMKWKPREIDFKIVYYGPPLSGKTTNLEQIHAKMVDTRRSELVSLKTEGERTLFFDFLPIELGEIGGFKPRIRLYTVPGQSVFRDGRRLILDEVDGIVFVADSQRSRLDDNARAFEEMKRHLQTLGYNWYELPLVLQYNKRDAPNRVSEYTLQCQLNPDETLPYFTSIANQGIGVIETLKHSINLVLLKSRQEM